MKRSIKRLLVLLKEEFEHGDHPGLCSAVNELYDDFPGVTSINSKERDILQEYIHDNAPWNKNTWWDKLLFNDLTGYFWQQWYKEPRIKWLDKHIKLNK